MSFDVVLHTTAFTDIDDAVSYYFQISPQLALDVYAEIFDSIDVIADSPYFQFRYKDYRAFPLKRFPYLILYTLNEKEMKIHVYAIFNTYQNTDKYPK
ncbi:MAG: type II toxin-antitoxin system RelE/ParE family toxin [Bacteroidetes bacterium]|nr:type II toxin-antitoxin system RelE/ParE family toxin [Bacteroidota bacterium]MBK9480401.1 type II toxin-antitoxin system RelE/ParE family toxin [Bacteroidota bacterium]